MCGIGSGGAKRGCLTTHLGDNRCQWHQPSEPMLCALCSSSYRVWDADGKSPHPKQISDCPRLKRALGRKEGLGVLIQGIIVSETCDTSGAAPANFSRVANGRVGGPSQVSFLINASNWRTTSGFCLVFGLGGGVGGWVWGQKKVGVPKMDLVFWLSIQCCIFSSEIFWVVWPGWMVLLDPPPPMDKHIPVPPLASSVPLGTCHLIVLHCPQTGQLSSLTGGCQAASQHLHQLPSAALGSILSCTGGGVPCPWPPPLNALCSLFPLSSAHVQVLVS